MAYDATDALDLLDLAIGRAADITEPEALTPYARTAADIRSRLGFLGRSVVVALVGGTGSGKSSLLNALAGEHVASTGVVRPTTERPLAWIPANPEPGLVRLLDDLAVEDRIGHDSFGEIAVLDLPDTDSVVRTHREIVEQLLPRVDAVIWVLDPEKYNDGVLHRDFLKPLHGYASQFLFVLNQIDRLTPAEEKAVVADLRRSLAADGITDPQLLAVAADPEEGPPIGIARLSRDLLGRSDAKEVVMAKVITDLRRARDGIAATTGISPGAGTSYDDRWDETAGRVAATLVASMGGEGAAERAGKRAMLEKGGGPLAAAANWWRSRRLARAAGMTDPADQVRLTAGPHLTKAATQVSEFVADLSFETGGAFGRLLRSEAVPDDVETEMARVVEAGNLEVGEFQVKEPASSWRVAGIVQWLLAGLFLAGIIWLWADPTALQPGGDIRPLSLAVGSVIVGLALRVLVIDGGRRLGHHSLTDYRATLQASIQSGLDRRVGAPIRGRMRSRAEVAGALSELSMVTAALESDLTSRF